MKTPNLSFFFLILISAFSSPRAFSQAPNPSLGLVANSVSGHVGSTAVTQGSTIYSGDYLSTDAGGSMQVRIGALSIELHASSAAHIYRAPYGAVVELNHGTVTYSTPGGHENIVIVASDVRVTPVLSLADLGRVSIDNPCNISVFSQRGQADVHVGSESHLVEEGKAYRVRAENEVDYRKYLSPDANDYHDYHGHRPCAPLEMAKGHAPVAAGHSHFLLVVGTITAVATTWPILEALESPNRP
jgi:hypothetical protein